MAYISSQRSALVDWRVVTTYSWGLNPLDYDCPVIGAGIIWDYSETLPMVPFKMRAMTGSKVDSLNERSTYSVQVLQSLRRPGDHQLTGIVA